MKIKYLNIDEDVNVYVVGDIHACYTLLKEELKNINFDYTKDLLIGVGDIIDRGNENEKCVGLINEDWFVTVKGNHEDFCIQGVSNDHIAFYHKMTNNGGEWFYKQPEDTQVAIANIFEKLPFMLEVNYCGKKFGFVHADLPVEDWELAKEMLINNDIIDGRDFSDHLIWSRGIVNKDYVEIAQVDNVFFGHTVLPKITQIGNCTFLDTGGVFKKYDNGYNLSIVNLKDYV